jgi:outer membrane protein assembly factor BamB
LFASLVSSVFLIQTNGQTSQNPNLLAYEWPQFIGDSAFTRFSAGPAPDRPNVLWKANVSGIQTYLSAFDGKIFVGTNTSVVALNQQTGEQVWKTDIPMPRPWPIAYKIDDGHMVVENSCLNPKSGALIWTSTEFNADTGIFSSNVYSPEEKMFYLKVDSYTEGWSFVDPSRPPTLIWRTYIPGGGRTGIGTTYGDGLVFAGSFENLQMALDAKTGDVVWNTLTKGPMIFAGSYSEGRFFRGGTDDNTMYAFNSTTGETLWTYKPDTDGYFTSGCAVAYGLVYSLNKDGYLYAFDVETGTLIWRYQGPGTLLWPGFPTVADGKVYATTGEVAQYGGNVGVSEFACLNAYNGELIWKLPIEALAPRESVAIAYGKLFLIPGTVTDAVDAISGSEYDSFNQVWAIGSNEVVTSDWPMWRADPTHSSTATFGPSNLTLAWKFATGGSVISSPSVANGILYVGSQDKYIYALGAYSGNLIWKFKTQSMIESSPAVANDRVYTGGDDGYVYCLDAYTGSLYWKTFVNGDLPYTYGSFVLKSSPAVHSGRIFVGSIDGNMYAIDAGTGNIAWKFQTGGPIHSSPAVFDGAVYFTAEEPDTGTLYKVDATSGMQLWKQEIPYEFQFTGGNQMLGSPSVADGKVFASASLRAYYAFDVVSGEVVWQFSEPSAMEFIASCPLYVDGQLFIINKFSITSLDAKTGKENWSFFTGDELYTSLSYAEGKLYMMTSQRHIYILDAKNNGSKLASYTTPSGSWSSPTIANNRLYIGNHDWGVYCFTNTATNAVVVEQEDVLTSPTYIAIVIIFLIAVVVLIILVVSFSRKLKKGDKPGRTFSWPSLKRQ